MKPVLKDKGSKKLYNKCGKKIFGYALDNLYFFEDDRIENLLDKALIKFKDRPDWRKATRAYLWSFQDIRNLICDVGYEMYAPREGEDEDVNCDEDSDTD